MVRRLARCARPIVVSQTGQHARLVSSQLLGYRSFWSRQYGVFDGFLGGAGEEYPSVIVGPIRFGSERVVWRV